MSAHTSGPWEFVPKLSASENHKGFFIRAEKASRNGKWALAEVKPSDEDGNLGEANARLIAAAPDLLDSAVEAAGCISACIEMLTRTGHTTTAAKLREYHARQLAVIAKATSQEGVV